MQINGLLDKLASQARRAILGTGVKTLAELSQMTEDEVLALHGIGVNALNHIERTWALLFQSKIDA